jgi:hypothetical protein
VARLLAWAVIWPLPAIFVERLAAELGSLERPVVLVVDDLQEFGAPDARRPRGLYASLAAV